MSDIKIKFSDKLIEIIKKLDDIDSYVAFELLYMSEPKSKYLNGLKITDIDVSEKDYHFLVKANGKDYNMKIGNFIRYYFKGLFSQEDISKFAKDYVKVSKGQEIDGSDIKRIEVRDFVYDPKDVRNTFLSLVTKTYPHFKDCRYEKEVLQFLPKLEEDEWGNYYKVIGENPTVMFTSHLDTADREQKETKLYSRQEGEDEIIITDGSTILGADDKAGVAVMLYMMAHNVKGLYYFFIGEERGGIGSNLLSTGFESTEHVKNIKKCVSFDRRKTISVITHQLGRECCSNDFGTALCKEFNKSGLNLSLDPTGVYTDSASLMDDIPECTNVSVGYENEHTNEELQNITYLEKLSKACLDVNWEGLPVVRKVGVNQELVRKHKKLIDDIKSNVWQLETKMVGFNDRIYIRIDLEDGDIGSIYDTLDSVNNLLNAYKISGDVLLVDTYIKIELK
jgi:hypothetical protein